MSAPKPPFRTTAEELLYAIYQKVEMADALKAEDIDSLAKLNAIIQGDTLLSSTEINNLLAETKGNPPAEFDTLEKVVVALATKQGDSKPFFPTTIFVSPMAVQEGVIGDVSRPFTVDAAMSVLSAGSTLCFLPGSYVINFNIARNGVMYKTLLGEVTITVNQINRTLFDYEQLDDSAEPVVIDGEFTFRLQALNSSIFKFSTKPTARKYFVRWRNCVQQDGTFMHAPLNIDGGVFEGRIDLEAASLYPAIKCNEGAPSAGTALMKLVVRNLSLSNYATIPNFQGFTFDINFYGTTYGLFGPTTVPTTGHNHYNLTIRQGAPCHTYLQGGSYDISIEGGAVHVVADSRVDMRGYMKNCVLVAHENSSSSINLNAVGSYIINDKVAILRIGGTWKTTQFFKTGPGLCILEGHFDGMQFNSSCGILKITGVVSLTPTTSIQVDEPDQLTITGKLFGNSVQLLLLNGSPHTFISGILKQKGEYSIAIKGTGSGKASVLSLNNAIIEVGANALSCIEVNNPDSLTLKLFGGSHTNKPLQVANLTYALGRNNQIIVSSQVTITE